MPWAKVCFSSPPDNPIGAPLGIILPVLQPQSTAQSEARLGAGKGAVGLGEGVLTATSMSKSKPRVLVMINPGASRAETAVPALSSWFSENCHALIVVANSKKKRKRELNLKLKKPVAVLPLGTANDFARTIGLPADPLQAAEVPLSGRKHRIDVGWFTSDPVSMSQASGPRPRSLRRRPRNSSRSGESLLM